MGKSISIRVSGQPVEVAPGATLQALRAERRPDAELTLLNGLSAPGDAVLSDGDEVLFLRRGEVPSREALEALTAARYTPEVLCTLRKSVVGIAGLGGLGSAVAVALVRAGVGKLVLADFDVVEPSNLNRQHYFIDQLGYPKVEALEANLLRINPYAELETYDVRLDPENILAIFGRVDVLVEGFDQAEEKAMLVSAFAKARPETPIVVASGLAGFGPSNTIVTRRLGETVVLVGDGVSGLESGEPLMAPRVGIAAHHQANAVVRLLLGEDPAG